MNPKTCGAFPKACAWFGGIPQPSAVPLQQGDRLKGVSLTDDSSWHGQTCRWKSPTGLMTFFS